jgi:hypothetical protein
MNKKEDITHYFEDLESIWKKYSVYNVKNTDVENFNK